MRSFLLLVTLLGISGCAYDPAYSDLTCDSEGATRPGQRCEGGVWVNGPDGGVTPDTGGGGDVTVPPQDMAAPEDMAADMGGPDTPCSAESDTLFCERLARDCGMVTGNDNCGDPRTVACGTCDAATETCTDNVCALIPETDQELCDAAGATCDDITAMDRTGAMRTVTCGMCSAPLQCGVGGTPNTCACLNADDQQFCADNGATCGPITAMDPVCMIERTVNCGTCNLPETCGGGGTANVCGCMESDAAFCARIGRNCGPVTDTDACGMSRTVNCGSCTLPESCGGGGQVGTCGCTTSNACFANSAQCGTVDVTGMCSNIATADCGGCGASGTCRPNNTCMCDSGYTFDGMSCVDVNECSTGADNCDANATCANVAGSFTCTCNNGYTGDGVTCSPVSSGPTLADEATGSSSADTVTTASISGGTDDLYVAMISIRTGSRFVQSVSGLGLTWRQETTHCNASDQQTIDIWTARGTSAGGAVTVGLNNDPYATIVAVYRVTNVPTGGARGAVVIRNANGIDGQCNGSSPASTYSFSYTPTYSNSLLLTGTAIASTSHQPGSGWTEEYEGHDSSFGTEGGLAVMSRANSATTAVTVEGTTSLAQNWVTGLFEVRGN